MKCEWRVLWNRRQYIIRETWEPCLPYSVSLCLPFAVGKGNSDWYYFTLRVSYWISSQLYAFLRFKWSLFNRAKYCCQESCRSSTSRIQNTLISSDITSRFFSTVAQFFQDFVQDSARFHTIFLAIFTFILVIRKNNSVRLPTTDSQIWYAHSRSASLVSFWTPLKCMMSHAWDCWR